MMRDDADIELCEPAPFIYYENGQLAVTDGAAVWLVIVTCEAMKATNPSPEEPIRLLTRYAELYRDLAASAIRRGDDVDGKVWITEAMVRSSVLTRGDRNASLARQEAAASGRIDHGQHGP